MLNLILGFIFGCFFMYIGGFELLGMVLLFGIIYPTITGIGAVIDWISNLRRKNG